MNGGSLFGAAEIEGSGIMQTLVVDDSAVYRKLIGDHLRSWGFGVTLAESGAEAWQVLERADAPKLGFCPISMALSFANASGKPESPVTTFT